MNSLSHSSSTKQPQAPVSNLVVSGRGWRRSFEIRTQHNLELLAMRERLQAQIDQWHRARVDRPFDAEEYQAFLVAIGYMQHNAKQVVQYADVDDEIARIAGPQLVVPLSNARYALNAANARWGSLYDALYGTDLIGAGSAKPQMGAFDHVRGAQVVAWAKGALELTIPLSLMGSHWDAVGYSVAAGELRAALADDRIVTLRDRDCFAGYAGDMSAPSLVLSPTDKSAYRACAGSQSSGR